MECFSTYYLLGMLFFSGYNVKVGSGSRIDWLPGSGSIIRHNESEAPDPYGIFTDPKHWKTEKKDVSGS